MKKPKQAEKDLDENDLKELQKRREAQKKEEAARKELEAKGAKPKKK